MKFKVAKCPTLGITIRYNMFSYFKEIKPRYLGTTLIQMRKRKTKDGQRVEQRAFCV